MRILMIEDSRLLRTAIGRMLSKAGHVVISAEDGQEGVRVARDSRPDLILLDLMLPMLEGTSVLRALKRDPDTKPIPVVVLSGLSPKNEQKLKHDGAIGFLQKGSLDLKGDGAAFITAVEAFMAPVSA